MKKQKLPKLRSDREAEGFVATSDLTQFDLSDLRLVRFKVRSKRKHLSSKKPS